MLLLPVGAIGTSSELANSGLGACAAGLDAPLSFDFQSPKPLLPISNFFINIHTQY